MTGCYASGGAADAARRARIRGAPIPLHWSSILVYPAAGTAGTSLPNAIIVANLLPIPSLDDYVTWRIVPRAWARLGARRRAHARAANGVDLGLRRIGRR